VGQVGNLRPSGGALWARLAAIANRRAGCHPAPHGFNKMAFHITNAQADELARALAARTGQTITDAVVNDDSPRPLPN